MILYIIFIIIVCIFISDVFLFSMDRKHYIYCCVYFLVVELLIAWLCCWSVNFGSLSFKVIDVLYCDWLLDITMFWITTL